MNIIKTERLLLRPLNETDAAEMFKSNLDIIAGDDTLKKFADAVVNAVGGKSR